MPEGSSSAAPVIRPGPSRCSSVGADLVGAATVARLEASGLDRFDRAHLPEIANSRFKREPARKVPSGSAGDPPPHAAAGRCGASCIASRRARNSAACGEARRCRGLHVKIYGALMRHGITPTQVNPLAPDQAAALTRDGYLLLRGAVPAAWRDALRAAFDARCRHRRPMVGAPRKRLAACAGRSRSNGPANLPPAAPACGGSAHPGLSGLSGSGRGTRAAPGRRPSASAPRRCRHQSHRCPGLPRCLRA